MDKFEPNHLEENAGVFNKALSNYLAEYEKVGICPKRFGNVAEFAEDYCKEILSTSAPTAASFDIKA